MFKIESVAIEGFWGTRRIETVLHDDVNVIIGRNGTGKTTLMNILHSVLTVDPEGLFENRFTRAVIKLKSGRKKRTISADRVDPDPMKFPFPFIRYQISSKSFTVPLFAPDESRPHSISIRRRSNEDAQQIREQISKLVSLASLSVYRIGGDIDPEARERAARRIATAVDLRLNSLTQRLTQYLLELSNEARKIATKLQRDVLVSLLYSEHPQSNSPWVASTFNEETERMQLTAAYKQLGVSGSDVSKKINDHAAAVARAVKELTSRESRQRGGVISVDVRALDALRTAQNVVRMSLSAEEETNSIFRQVHLFNQKLKDFIPDKDFDVSRGMLLLTKPARVEITKLSSGEKQLLILLIEALLQRQRTCIFLADEPELSLHIAWQRRIVRAIRELNPNAQVIVATHSPEIAGQHRLSVIDMEDISSEA